MIKLGNKEIVKMLVTPQLKLINKRVLSLFPD
jgi:hypothetical protein